MGGFEVPAGLVGRPSGKRAAPPACHIGCAARRGRPLLTEHGRPGTSVIAATPLPHRPGRPVPAGGVGRAGARRGRGGCRGPQRDRPRANWRLEGCPRVRAGAIAGARPAGDWRVAGAPGPQWRRRRALGLFPIGGKPACRAAAALAPSRAAPSSSRQPACSSPSGKCAPAWARGPAGPAWWRCRRRRRPRARGSPSSASRARSARSSSRLGRARRRRAAGPPAAAPRPRAAAQPRPRPAARTRPFARRRRRPRRAHGARGRPAAARRGRLRRRCRRRPHTGTLTAAPPLPFAALPRCSTSATSPTAASSSSPARGARAGGLPCLCRCPVAHAPPLLEACCA
jgi:hypothetical protein